MALVPLLWLAWLHWRGRDPGLAFWWLAGAFAVSWLADTAAHFANPWVVSKVYPVSQAAIVGMVFLSRRDAMLLIVVLALVGILDVLWIGIGDFDILLRTVAWLSVVGIVWPLRQLGRLRTSLLVYFGLGLAMWWGYAIWPGWTSWLGYQGVRAIGILWFCLAALTPGPRFTLARA